MVEQNSPLKKDFGVRPAGRSQSGVRSVDGACGKLRASQSDSSKPAKFDKLVVNGTIATLMTKLLIELAKF